MILSSFFFFFFFFFFFLLLFNERTGGKHGIQRAFCKVQKQVKLKEGKRRVGGPKDRWAVGEQEDGVGDWAAQEEKQN